MPRISSSNAAKRRDDESAPGNVFQLNGHICECTDNPLCRHHHRCKQAQGWQLEQPEPGILIWRTPAGRTYATIPAEYPM
jgi:hypothetical protein